MAVTRRGRWPGHTSPEMAATARALADGFWRGYVPPGAAAPVEVSGYGWIETAARRATRLGRGGARGPARHVHVAPGGEDPGRARPRGDRLRGAVWSCSGSAFVYRFRSRASLRPLGVM